MQDDLKVIARLFLSVEILFQALKYFSVEITRPNIMSRWKYPNILHFRHRAVSCFSILLQIICCILFLSSFRPQLERKITKIIRITFCISYFFSPHKRFSYFHTQKNSHVETRDEKLAERRKIIQCAQIFESRKGWSWRVISLLVTMVIDQIF